MGILLNEVTGKHVLLRDFHVIGRNEYRSDTYILDPDVSLMHATLRWQDGLWVIADHSRNGTFLDGHLLPKGEWVPLKIGQQVSFGSGSGNVWQIFDISSPCTSLLSDAPDYECIELAHNNLFPTPETPELSIYQTIGGQWILETLGNQHVLNDGDTVNIGDRQYKLIISTCLDKTLDGDGLLSVESMRLTFTVSQDEEHTQAQLQVGSKYFDLGEREHHYCLVTLARRRLVDSKRGVDRSAQGWLDCTQLAKMLGIDIQHLNIQIFRARNQIMKLLPTRSQLANIIERRRGSIRLGAFAFDIVHGSQIEGCYQPDESVTSREFTALASAAQ